MCPRRILLTFLFFAVAWSARLTPPPTRTDNVTETLHGVKITDPYRWLEDQDSPETRGWIDAQSKFARAYLDPLPGRDALRARLSGLLKIDSVRSPMARGGRYFFMRRLATEVRFSICMRQGLQGKDEIIVAPESVSADQNVGIDLLGVSDDATILAYGVRYGGEDESEIRLLDLRTRKLLPDTLAKGRYFSFDIQPDDRGYY